MKAPERYLLTQQTADVIEELILAGRWTSQLPGYRVLSKELGVSCITVQTALNILTQSEVLLPAEGRKARKIHPEVLQRVQRAEKQKNILILTEKPVQEIDIVSRQVFLQVTTLYTKKGWKIDFVNTVECRAGKPGPVLERLLRDSSEDYWLLHRPSHTLIQWCLKQNLQIICLGGEPHHLKVPCVAVSITDIVRASADHLAKQGHKRVCVLIDHMSERERSNYVKVVEETLSSHSIQFHQAYHLPIISQQDPQGQWETLEKLFATSPPTALIATEFSHLITIYSFCLKHSIQIPEDLSLIVSRERENIEWYHPQLAHYKYPVQSFITKISQWLENYPTEPAGTFFLKPKFVEGESIREMS